MILRKANKKPVEGLFDRPREIFAMEIAGFEPTYIAHKYRLQPLLMTNSVTTRLHFYC